MSNSLRDMFVGIQFDDGVSKTIDKIDGKMDELERGFIKFGTKVDKSGQGLKTMGNTGVKATNQVADGFKKSERELTDFTDEVDDSHQGLRKVGTVGDKATDELEQGFKKSEKEAKGFNREVKNSDDALGGIKRAAAGLAGIIAGAFAVEKIKDFALSGIENAASMKALNSQFEQVFGLMDLTAEAKLNNIAKNTGILPERLKGSFVQIAAFAKTTGAETEEAMSLAERATLAAADSAAFQDRSIEDVTENLRSLLKGNFENDAALGISVTETTRNTKAIELFNKKFKDLNELQKQDALLSMVEDSHRVTGAIGQAAKEADGFENVIGNFDSAWNGLKSTMMTPFLEPVTKGLISLTKQFKKVDAKEMGLKMKSGFDNAMDVVVPTFEAIKDGVGFIQENKEPLIAGLSGIAAGFVALKVISTVSGMMALYQGSAFAATVATHGLNAALRANPIGLVVTGIGLLVAGGVALYRNFDTVKTKTVELWGKLNENPFTSFLLNLNPVIVAGKMLYQNFDKIKSSFNNFKNAITNFEVPGWVSSISGAVQKVGGLINGSHATGLANVPFDGYRAELHKGESVLTAEQSNTLRGLGVLGSDGNGKPTINTAATSIPVAVSTPSNVNSSAFSINVPIELIVQGNADDSSIQKLMAMLPAEVKRVIEEIFREKLAGIGG